LLTEYSVLVSYRFLESSDWLQNGDIESFMGDKICRSFGAISLLKKREFYKHFVRQGLASLSGGDTNGET